MNAVAGIQGRERYRPVHKLRFVTAAALFDGHDASINLMRRILQAQGAEVIHLGHNRSVESVVSAALDEDVQGIAVSSYQGGHVEYFRYMIDLLRARGGGHIRVYGGGGGVIVPAEIAELQDYGVARLFSPEDGQRLGLAGMINLMVEACDVDLAAQAPATLDGLRAGDRLALARWLSVLEAGRMAPALRDELLQAAQARRAPVLGITGTGGAGKSSLTDELIRRFRLDRDEALKIAVLAADPVRRRSGGALLGDRIRMNAIEHPNLYLRSLATPAGGSELPQRLDDLVAACRVAGFDLVIIETPGIGQGAAGIVAHADLALYVMTPEYGAASQLEKIDMLDFADVVAINKYDRPGGADALRDVRRQVQRNREDWGTPPADLPVFGTIASRFSDDGVTALYQHLLERLAALGLPPSGGRLAAVTTRASTGSRALLPPARVRHLAAIAETVRAYHRRVDEQAGLVRSLQQVEAVQAMLRASGADPAALDPLAAAARAAIDPQAARLLADWPAIEARHRGEAAAVTETLAGSRVPKIALPHHAEDGERLRFLMKEHLPGHFPFTAGVFEFKRESEEPTRMFAGEGDAFRTNRRFHLLADGQPATRLSTAFDSVTLYGADPDPRPDIFGKIGNAGVSIATLDDMQALFEGFDLCAPATSVSMTINGPAPAMLAMFLNTAIDAALARFAHRHGRAAEAAEAQAIRAQVLHVVRGTVQADILKEDQGQNTCLFSIEFALRLMADMQAYFVEHAVRNFYSVSISGYHIAEAGANPVTQLAFTLANGFTYVEAYRARGMDIDDFAPNLSFFFSNGMDPEYAVLGRVARRIWAIALRDHYGGSERSQKLKYHIQTSGRSLHAQEMAFNDIRTTLQALIAIYDHCNSLHTNAFDEAVTTPTEASVRRALAIQLIIHREWGLARCENPNQGAFIIETLTDLVEEAVLCEFERLSERGGVLGAMETGYQRSRIQEESMKYETRKHDGSLPIVGVNTFTHADAGASPPPPLLARSTEAEKQSQLERLRAFHARHAAAAPAMLERLKQTAIAGGNVFAVLMDAVRCCSLGQITTALFEVGGQYRRNL